MMKKMVLFLILIIILIILSFIGYNKFVKSNKQSYVTLMYNELVKSKQYQFMTEDINTNKIVVSSKNKKEAIDMYNKGGRTTTLIEDGFTYYIDHANKEYYVYSGDENQNIILDELSKIKDMQYTKGKEKIYGKQYKYEEYNNVDSFAMNVHELNEGGIKTRFYFDSKGEIVYIKTINANQEELLKAKIVYEVPDDAVNIPSDYAENK